jgi:tetratricopeptide (TPR) repeat protein/nitrate/TMAO reductase-like tetraheme cytochrome c subunit
VVVTPLIQYLAPFPGGRLQAVDMAYDTRSNEWFYVFNDERMPHEWGYWTNRSMNWNSQCAFCHMTGFEKRYDIKTDRYASTWKAMAISCAQCHVIRDQRSEARGQRSEADGPCPMTLPHKPITVNHSPAMDSCASCHARREELFGTFQPGDSFHDHFRLTLPDQPGIFHADGQVLEEDFEYASFMMSRMGHQGVTCMDCHNPHSGRLVAPVENNTLCMSCHISPGLQGATPVDPVGHSFHKPGGPGSRCIDCHMPVNFYMVRDGRRDHGFTSPDPLLTIEHGIPNACNRCHDDQTPEWANEWTDTWYGEKMNRRARDRARIVARYHNGDATVQTQLLAMAASEEIDAWHAALTAMLQPWSANDTVRKFLQGSLTHPHPLVRSAAIRSLQDAPITALSDPSALVRADATMARYERHPGHPPPTLAELRAYLNNICDQPAGALRQAQLAMIEKRTNDAEAWTIKARDWDPSAVPHYYLGRLQHTMGKLPEAVSNLTVAAQVAEDNAEYSYTLALLIAEGGDNDEARRWLEETVRRAPDFGRAWYNLGLALAGQEKLKQAREALVRAESLLPGSADVPYALATVFAREGELSAAREAAERALNIAPDHAPSLGLLRSLPVENQDRTRPTM